jgi:uncharacterized protein DUF4406
MTEVYISSKMTGVKNYNFEMFDKVARSIWLQAESIGLELSVVSPSHLSMRLGTMQKYTDYLEDDLRALIDCGVIIMVGDWGSSLGAKLELEYAGRLKKGIFYLANPDAESAYVGLVNSIKEYIDGKDSNS